MPTERAGERERQRVCVWFLQFNNQFRISQGAAQQQPQPQQSLLGQSKRRKESKRERAGGANKFAKRARFRCRCRWLRRRRLLIQQFEQIPFFSLLCFAAFLVAAVASSLLPCLALSAAALFAFISINHSKEYMYAKLKQEQAQQESVRARRALSRVVCAADKS